MFKKWKYKPDPWIRSMINFLLKDLKNPYELPETKKN